MANADSPLSCALTPSVPAGLSLAVVMPVACASSSSRRHSTRGTTCSSTAVMDARDFFEESAKAAWIVKKRAVLLYGIFNEPPKILDETIAGFDYAPYSEVFPRAACVVHQGGVGTTAQVLRAGVPHLIMPFSHDQPDNAERCRRAGVAEVIGRDKYTAETAARKLEKILNDKNYKSNAAEAAPHGFDA